MTIRLKVCCFLAALMGIMAAATSAFGANDCATQAVLVENIAKEARTKKVDAMETSIAQSGVRSGFADQVGFLAKSAEVMNSFPLKSVAEYYAIACLWNLSGGDIKKLVARASEVCPLTTFENDRIGCLSTFVDGVAKSLRQGSSR